MQYDKENSNILTEIRVKIFATRINEKLARLDIDESMTSSIQAINMLDAFSKGKVVQPKLPFLQTGKPPKQSFDDIRRAINKGVGRAETKQDRAGMMAITRAYNEWIEDLTQQALTGADLEQYANLVGAIGITAKVKALFTSGGRQDVGGTLLEKIMDTVDSPEGVIGAFLTTGFKGPPKNGAVEAAKRMKTILLKEQPEAWHAARQAYWLKLSRGQNIYKEGPITRAELDIALGQVHRNISDAMTNQMSLMRVLYTSKELKTVRNFGRMARRSQSINPNPSGTSYSAAAMRQKARDHVLPGVIRRQAMGEQLAGRAMSATAFRVMAKRAVSILGYRGEVFAAKEAGRMFSPRLPKKRISGGGGLGGAAAVQIGEE